MQNKLKTIVNGLKNYIDNNISILRKYTDDKVAEISANNTTQPDWNQNDDTAPDYIKNKPSVVTEDDMQATINEVLTQAKESGVFDGKDGYTPIKGTDYFTEEDKHELIEAILSQVTDGNEVNY